MKIFAAVTSLLISFSACAEAEYPRSIPVGSWEYRLLVNGSEIGSATVTGSREGDLSVTSTFMEMRVGQVVNTTRQTVKEGPGFTPVSYELVNTIRAGTAEPVKAMDITARFSGGTVELAYSGAPRTITIDRPYIVEGNWFMQQLVDRQFATGTEVEALLYDPTIDPGEPVPVTMKVMGRETLNTGGKSLPVIRLLESIGQFKNIEIYIDTAGITRRVVIYYLNNTIELVYK